MLKTLLATVIAVSGGYAIAKLPPIDDAAKAKAAETAAKAAWQAKIDGFQLCKAQDKVAAKYGSGGMKPVVAKAGASGAAKPASSAAAAAAAAAPATAASGTPVAGVATPPPTIPPCNDPGPFAYNPPEQKPLETSGAHSPAGNAASPPSVAQDSAAMRQSSAAKKP